MKTEHLLIPAFFLMFSVALPHSNYASGDVRNHIIESAKKYIGTRYRFGGTGRRGFDCSGFVRHVYAKFNIRLPHSSSAQYRESRKITRKEVLPGDLVFFTTYRPGPSHVGIYLGNGRFIHSPRPGKRIHIADMNGDYWRRRYIGCGTFLK